jgi:hypothetical protein
MFDAFRTGFGTNIGNIVHPRDIFSLKLHVKQ